MMATNLTSADLRKVANVLDKLDDLEVRMMGSVVFAGDAEESVQLTVSYDDDVQCSVLVHSNFIETEYSHQRER
jgi:hypothetical protein